MRRSTLLLCLALTGLAAAPHHVRTGDAAAALSQRMTAGEFIGTPAVSPQPNRTTRALEGLLFLGAAATLLMRRAPAWRRYGCR